MITANGAWILLPFVVVIAGWASWSDLKRLKIPNAACLALAAVWLSVGWLAVPTWQAWGWGFALMGIVLLLGYLAYLTGTFGAGDAKYAAAMAPIFVGADISLVLTIVPATMVGALITHRIMRRIPAIRRMTPDWQSWEERLYFPFGFAMSGILVIYVLAALWP